MAVEDGPVCVPEEADINVRLVNQAERRLDRAGIIRGQVLQHHRNHAPPQTRIERLAQVRG